MSEHNLTLPVLKLNSNWQACGVTNVRQSFLDAAAGAATLLRFHEGSPTPYRLVDWLNIPVGDKEPWVGISSKFHEIRKVAIPRVQIEINFDRIIGKKRDPNNMDHLLGRYGHKDAVTGLPLRKEDASREHVRPRSKGGGGGWENIAPMDKRLNSKRGNKSYRKVGLKKPKLLPAPGDLLPIHWIVNTQGYEEWDLFHIRRP